MTSTVVFLSCLGVLVPQQSPKLPEEPSEAQLLAMITNAYKENYGKIKKSRATIKTNRIFTLNGILNNFKSSTELSIDNGKIKFDVFDQSGKLEIEAVKQKDLYTVIDYGNSTKEVLLGRKTDLPSMYFLLHDPSCYGNNLNFETIPDVLGKIQNLKIKYWKVHNDTIIATGIYNDLDVALHFSGKTNYLCCLSSFGFTSKETELVNVTIIEYLQPSGCDFLFPKLNETYSATYTLKNNQRIPIRKAEYRHDIDFKLDKTIGDEVFNLKIPAGYEVKDLTKGASAPAENVK